MKPRKSDLNKQNLAPNLPVSSFQDPKYNAVLSLLEITPETLGMYTIPWVDQDITVRALERYAACNQKIDTQALEQFDIKPYIWWLLESQSMDDQILWIGLLVNLDNTTYLSAESVIFQSPFPWVWRKRIYFINKHEKRNLDIRRKFADFAFEKLIGSSDKKMYTQASLFINLMSEEKLINLLDNNIIKVLLQKDISAIKNILFRCAIKWYIIKTHHMKEIISILVNSIETNQPLDNTLLILSCVEYIPEKYHSDRLKILVKLLDSNHQDVWIKSIQMVDSFHYDLSQDCWDVSTIIFEKIKKYIDSDSLNDQLLVAYSINHFGISTIIALLDKFWIKDQDSKAIDWIYPEAVCQMLVSSKQIQWSVKSLNKNKEAWLLYIQPPLYKKDFVKRGWAELTINNNTLMWKTIVRHFPPEQFLAWKKLYEDHALRKEQGFDYVPVEPIQAFYQRELWLVDIYAWVLDCNLAERINVLGKWLRQRELECDLNKIQDTFDSIGFVHGHTWGNPSAHNCVLRFWRTEEGGVDFTKKPRIYVIDFDQAKWIDNHKD